MRLPIRPILQLRWAGGGAISTIRHPADERDDNGDGVVDDAREAGIRPPGNHSVTNQPFANDEIVSSALSSIPLFAENAASPFVDGNRNPGMMYQPMSRLGNLVTERSGVFAIWITVGYFEVEKAPDWNDPMPNSQCNSRSVQRRCHALQPRLPRWLHAGP